ncbi:MAG: large conductance mechanosensitive channel protein MscL [Clostridia bacterium]|nr:large conductance mechanosensitive channel protein MscL [Clostridia bacterium]
MKNFFPEFKKFITRGNVVDMSVGVIVGGAFTAIVNGMGNFILKPIVNALLALIFGADSLSEIYTFLKTAYKDVVDEAGAVIGQEIDLANSIYIDWGAFINAVLNFFITAFVLFTIVKIINKMKEGQSELDKKKLTREQRKELRANGIKLRDRDAVKAYFAEKQRVADEAAAAEAAALAEAARLDREANPTTEDLLKLILAELKNK